MGWFYTDKSGQLFFAKGRSLYTVPEYKNVKTIVWRANNTGIAELTDGNLIVLHKDMAMESVKTYIKQASHFSFTDGRGGYCIDHNKINTEIITKIKSIEFNDHRIYCYRINFNDGTSGLYKSSTDHRDDKYTLTAENGDSLVYHVNPFNCKQYPTIYCANGEAIPTTNYTVLIANNCLIIRIDNNIVYFDFHVRRKFIIASCGNTYVMRVKGMYDVIGLILNTRVISAKNVVYGVTQSGLLYGIHANRYSVKFYAEDVKNVAQICDQVAIIDGKITNMTKLEPIKNPMKNLNNGYAVAIIFNNALDLECEKALVVDSGRMLINSASNCIYKYRENYYSSPFYQIDLPKINCPIKKTMLRTIRSIECLPGNLFRFDLYWMLLDVFATEVKNIFINDKYIYDITVELKNGETHFAVSIGDSLLFEDGRVVKFMPSDGRYYCGAGAYTQVPHQDIKKMSKYVYKINGSLVHFTTEVKKIYKCGDSYISTNPLTCGTPL